MKGAFGSKKKLSVSRYCGGNRSTPGLQRHRTIEMTIRRIEQSSIDHFDRFLHAGFARGRQNPVTFDFLSGGPQHPDQQEWKFGTTGQENERATKICEPKAIHSGSFCARSGGTVGHDVPACKRHGSRRDFPTEAGRARRTSLWCRRTRLDPPILGRKREVAADPCPAARQHVGTGANLTQTGAPDSRRKVRPGLCVLSRGSQ